MHHMQAWRQLATLAMPISYLPPKTPSFLLPSFLSLITSIFASHMPPIISVYLAISLHGRWQTLLAVQLNLLNCLVANSLRLYHCLPKDARAW